MLAFIGTILIGVGTALLVASLFGVRLLRRGGDKHTMNYTLFWASSATIIAGAILMFFNNGFTSIP